MEIQTIKSAIWKSTFPDDAPALRLTEIAWMKAGKKFDVVLPLKEKIQLLYTLNGSGKLIYKGNVYVLEPMKAYLIDRSESARIVSNSDDWVFCRLEINGAMAYNVYFYLTRENGYVNYADTEISLLLKNIYEIAHRGWNQKADVQISCILYQITTLLFVAEESQKKFEGSIKYIREHYKEEIHLDDLAKASNMSKYHFSHSFRKLFGCTPVEYINQYRMERAQGLLISTNYPISLIANQVGINDRSYFAKLFQKYSGYPPKEFQKAFSE